MKNMEKDFIHSTIFFRLLFENKIRTFINLNFSGIHLLHDKILLNGLFCANRKGITHKRIMLGKKEIESIFSYHLNRKITQLLPI